MAIVRPIITYGAIEWGNRVTPENTKADLGKIQRLACVNIMGIMRYYPTAALEVINDLTLLYLEVFCG